MKPKQGQHGDELSDISVDDSLSDPGYDADLDEPTCSSWKSPPSGGDGGDGEPCIRRLSLDVIKKNREDTVKTKYRVIRDGVKCMIECNHHEEVNIIPAPHHCANCMMEEADTD